MEEERKRKKKEEKKEKERQKERKERKRGRKKEREKERSVGGEKRTLQQLTFASSIRSFLRPSLWIQRSMAD